MSRALQRISSRTDTPTLATTQQEDESTEMPSPSPTRTANGSDFLHPAAPRTSMQAHRPHLSTTMSNIGVPQAPPGGSPVANDPNPVTPTSVTQGASIEQSVRLFKVFEALRSGDTAAIVKACKGEGDSKLEGTTVLHLAIQCAEHPVIEYVLSQQAQDVNARDREGNTPLHVAAMLGRAPVVKLLLDQKDISDAVVNYSGKTPLDLARTPDIFQQLQLARSMFIDANVRKVHQLVTSGDYDALEELLADTRVKSIIDVNGPELTTDPATTEHGLSLIHI